MKFKLFYLVMPVTALILTGCMMEQSRTLPPGQYEDNSSSVDSKGTLRETNKETDVYYDQYGNKKYTTTQKTVTDPKGLFNKSTTSSSHTSK